MPHLAELLFFFSFFLLIIIIQLFIIKILVYNFFYSYKYCDYHYQTGRVQASLFCKDESLCLNAAGNHIPPYFIFWRKNVHNTGKPLRGLSLPSKRVVR